MYFFYTKTGLKIIQIIYRDNILWKCFLQTATNLIIYDIKLLSIRLNSFISVEDGTYK